MLKNYCALFVKHEGKSDLHEVLTRQGSFYYSGMCFPDMKLGANRHKTER